ncbi:MAG: PD-(D/E)XK nuclease family protein, partial [Bacteroidota bacterium]
AVPEVSVDAQQYFTSAWPPPLAQEGLKTFDAVAPESTQLRYGRMVHRLLEQLTSLDVLPTVLANFRVQEDIGQEELDQVEQQLITILRHPLVKDWFSDAWDVRSEATILSSTGQVLRPDRVLLKPGRAVVIDFKTGGQHIQDKGQVQDYMALLRAMGHAQVEGYLLYLDEGTVVAC